MEKYLIGFIVGIVALKTIQNKVGDFSKEVERDVTLLEKYEEGRSVGFAAGRQFQVEIHDVAGK